MPEITQGVHSEKMNSTDGNPPAPRQPTAGREFFFHIVLTLSFFLSITFVPLAGFFTGILTPLPTALALIKFGLPAASVVPAVSGLFGSLVLFLMDMSQSIPYFAAMLAMGMILGYGIGRSWPSEKVVGLASLLVISISGIILVITLLETGGELVRLLEEDFSKAITTTLSQLGKPSSEARELESSLLAAVPLIVRIMPGITISCTLGICWLNMLIARRYCRTAAPHVGPMEDLTRWKAPETLVWLVIASGLVLIAPLPDLKYPALNALVVLGSIYFLQGLAIASFFLAQWKLPFFMRALIYAVLALQQFASMATAMVGLFDMWFDFRRMVKKPA
ncbi:MAG: YybS family protein [Syntrophobacter sp.]